ncbi:MAG: trypsin-like peptidase domain-containing protein [Acidimicrobiia bacterium]|nr:trypsin-like peptidase domain-containing protein [Acidimicrobiia bacterium]
MIWHPPISKHLKVAAILAAMVASGVEGTCSIRAVPTYGADDGGPSLLLSNADGSNAYASIVRYQGRATCTGVFIDTIPEGQDPGDAPAYVLSNGHCSNFPGPNEVLIDRPAVRNRVIFNFFADTRDQQVAVPVARIAYASMKGQDIAVLELAERYADITAMGFASWRPSLKLPERNEPVVIVGAPLQHNPETAFLRLAACQVDGRVPHVLEFNWHWYDFDRYTCAGIQSGSSGSPVISRLTGRLLGLVNTTTAGGRPRYTECSLDHPCEPAAGSEESRPETSYATPLVRLDRCFDRTGRFNLRGSGCPLDPGDQLRVTPTFIGPVNPGLATVPIGRPRYRWDVSVSGPFELYRYKVAAVPSQDCRDLRGYSPPRRVGERPIIDDPLPTDDGWRFLCVVGGSQSRWGNAWQSIDFPTVVSARIDTVPPRIEAPLTIEDIDLSWRVRFTGLAPEISFYTFKYGPSVETRCDDASGYRPAVLPFIAIPKSGGPYTFCAVPYDSAFNPGKLIEERLP